MKTLKQFIVESLDTNTNLSDNMDMNESNNLESLNPFKKILDQNSWKHEESIKNDTPIHWEHTYSHPNHGEIVVRHAGPEKNWYHERFGRSGNTGKSLDLYLKTL